MRVAGQARTDREAGGIADFRVAAEVNEVIFRNAGE